jgi:hypothetical protein
LFIFHVVASREERIFLTRQNWQRLLPRPIVIPKIMTLSTLEDVRAFLNEYLPAEYRAKQIWRYVAVVMAAAASGQVPTAEVAAAVRLVLSIEGVTCR